MKSLVIIFLLITTQAFAQESPNLYFSTLNTLKTITSKNIPSQYEIVLKTNDPNSFIVKVRSNSDQDSQIYLLQKAQRNKWVLFDLSESDSPYSPRVNGIFFIYQYRSGTSTRGNVQGTEHYVVIDMKKHSALYLTSFFEIQRQVEYDEKRFETDNKYADYIGSLPYLTHDYETRIKISGVYLTRKTTCYIDSLKHVEPFSKKIYKIADYDNIDPGGVYKYINGIFVKIKTYKWGFKGLQPVK